MAQKKEATKSIYRLTHLTSGKVAHIPATNPKKACTLVGWQMEDCHVLKLEPSWLPDGTHHSGFKVLLPCRLCPFQWAECLRGEDANCPIITNAPDFHEWLKQATQAHLCPHVGGALLRFDYKLHQKPYTVEEAITLLTA